MNPDLIVERRTPLPASPEEAFAWHARPGGFERLVPPWHQVRVTHRSGGLEAGSTVALSVGLGPFTLDWIVQHSRVEPGRCFTDVQLRGPFDRWEHLHAFEPGPEGTCVLHDRISCTLPALLRPAEWLARHELDRLLAYRHALTAADLTMHAAAVGSPRLHVAVTGASGLIGSILIPALTAGGHKITRIVRRAAGPGEITWDPMAGRLDPGALRGIDAVVHLAGENIATGRWSADRKARLASSRVSGTRLLAKAMAQAPGGPRTMVSASAIGYYGERGEDVLQEAAGPGRGFLPELAVAWETASRPAVDAGIRVVSLRIGLVLTPAGGLLQRMLLPFRLGLGGRLAGGSQWMSWISADDLVGAFHHVLTSPAISGPVNAVAPVPVRNAEFTTALAHALHRPAPFPVPGEAIRLLFGQMADEAILASTRVHPGVLEATGYHFRHPTLPNALAHVLGTRAGGGS